MVFPEGQHHFESQKFFFLRVRRGAEAAVHAMRRIDWTQQRVEAVLSELVERGLYKIVQQKNLGQVDTEVNNLLRCLGLTHMNEAEQDVMLKEVMPKEWGNNRRGICRAILHLIFTEADLARLRDMVCTGRLLLLY